MNAPWRARPFEMHDIGNSLTPNAKFLPERLVFVKSSTFFANAPVIFEGSRSADPPTIFGIASAHSSMIRPNATLVAMSVSQVTFGRFSRFELKYPSYFFLKLSFSRAVVSLSFQAFASSDLAEKFLRK